MLAYPDASFFSTLSINDESKGDLQLMATDVFLDTASDPDFLSSSSSCTSSPTLMSMDLEYQACLNDGGDDGHMAPWTLNTEEMMMHLNERNVADPIEPWRCLPSHMQEQLYTHCWLYLQEIQQVLELQTPPSSPYPSSPIDDTSSEKRNKSPNFKVDHYKIQNKRARSDSYSSYSSSDDMSSPISSPSLPKRSYTYNSNTDKLPASTYIAAKELANAMLPPISQVEEAMRAGTSSQSAAKTVLELAKRPELLTLKQSDAARIMGISTSVLSKRWREATRGKKWPHRIHHKLKRAEIS